MEEAISIRCINILRENGFVDDEGNINFEALSKLTEAEILRLPNCGRKSLNEIKVLLSAKSMTLGAFYQKDREQQNSSWPSTRDMDIYRLRRSGLTYKKVGEKYGIGPARTSEICKKMERRMRHSQFLTNVLLGVN